MKTSKIILGLSSLLLLVGCGNNPATSSTISSIESSSSSDLSSSSPSSSSSSSSKEDKMKFQTFNGSFAYGANAATTTGTNNLCVITNKSFTKGTVKMNMNANGAGKSGFIFCAAGYPTSYYFAGIETSLGNRLILTKKVDGNETEIGASYITAGYSTTSVNELKVVYESGKIQVFYNNCLFISRTEASPLNSDRVGLFSMNAGASYQNIVIKEEKDFKTVDTLIIGHSYMELWKNYKSDLSRYPDIHNIGIGGTASSDWKGHHNEVVDYAPTKLIYMIGINDVPRGLKASEIMGNISSLVNGVLASLPNTKVCLVSINQTVTHVDYVSLIKETNKLMWNYVGLTDRTCYANVDNAFLKADGTPDGNCFVDGLHPTEASYKVIAQAIYDAFDGKNQPEAPTENKIKDLMDDFSSSTLKSNGNDWTIDTLNKRITTSAHKGHLCSSATYGDFSLGVAIDGSASGNPFFTKKAEEGIFLGDITDGNYAGYVINFCTDWIEVCSIDGATNDCTFVDGWNVIPPFGKTVVLSMSGGYLFATDSNGNPIASSTYGGKSSILLSGYDECHIGVFSHDGAASVYSFESFFIGK